jgi:YesN/AraC family two-component response regulator
MPLTVFVTGYDRFAVQAVEADVTDYLLKPFSDTRYGQMMERVRRRVGEKRAGERPARVHSDPSCSNSPQKGTQPLP